MTIVVTPGVSFIRFETDVIANRNAYLLMELKKS